MSAGNLRSRCAAAQRSGIGAPDGFLITRRDDQIVFVEGGNMHNVEARTMDTLSQIQAMLSKEYDLPLERLGPEQPLADLGIDSLTTIEFMFKLEDKFSIRLSEERGDLSTVNDIAVLVDAVLQRETGRV
jgi:acyl carrier protein